MHGSAAAREIGQPDRPHCQRVDCFEVFRREQGCAAGAARQIAQEGSIRQTPAFASKVEMRTLVRPGFLDGLLLRKPSRAAGQGGHPTSA